MKYTDIHQKGILVVGILYLKFFQVEEGVSKVFRRAKVLYCCKVIMVVWLLFWSWICLEFFCVSSVFKQLFINFCFSLQQKIKG